jgi:hypothetical protein
MKKEYINSLIETSYLIDFTLFDDVPKKELSESEFKNYLKSKYAFIHNLYEMYYFLNLDMSNNQSPYSSTEEFIDFVENKVSDFTDSINDILSEDNVIDSLREEFNSLQESEKQMDISKFVNLKQKSLVIDSLFVENVYYDKELTENYKFKLLTNSYDFFKNKLLEYVR